MKRAEARIDLGAIRDNCARLARELRGDAVLCAVVKADGYGHGAVEAAGAAMRGGARWLAVATADEAAQLRAAGVDARLLGMGAPRPGEPGTAPQADAGLGPPRGGWVRPRPRG